MSLLAILLLALIQGAAEVLPVSSSAHVIVAEKLLGLDPASPEMAFLLVMLHTGTMGAAIVYFRKRWSERLKAGRKPFLQALVLGTGATLAIGGTLLLGIERVLRARGLADAEVEELFRITPLIAGALLAAGLLILAADRASARATGTALSNPISLLVGGVQGLTLPFRGFSRSGATISAGMLGGVSRDLAEDYSFALVVVLTPIAIAWELHRLIKHSGAPSVAMFLPGLVGMAASFAAGLAGLAWLTAWLEKGRWAYFGIYCLVASAALFAAHLLGLL